MRSSYGTHLLWSCVSRSNDRCATQGNYLILLRTNNGTGIEPEGHNWVKIPSLSQCDLLTYMPKKTFAKARKGVEE